VDAVASYSAPLDPREAKPREFDDRTCDGCRIATAIELREISNLTVRLLSQYTGRGPTKARTYLNDDMVTVVLQDTDQGRDHARRERSR